MIRLPESKIKLTLITTVAIFVGSIALSQFFELLGFPEQDQVQQIRRMAGWNTRFVFTVAWILIATPIIEETLFRFPTRFVRHPAFAVVISIFFSFCHYIDFASLAAGHGFALLPLSNAFLALVFIGVSLCWLYRRTCSLWCSMLSHSLFNATSLVLALVIR